MPRLPPKQYRQCTSPAIEQISVNAYTGTYPRLPDTMPTNSVPKLAGSIAMLVIALYIARLSSGTPAIR